MNKIRVLEEENSNVKWVEIDDNFECDLVDWIRPTFNKIIEKAKKDIKN